MRALTSEQEELVCVLESGMPLLPEVAVVADAGSGKTTVLVERVKRILSVRKSERALCVSFTEKSAADLQFRLRDESRAMVFTIHGFCSQMLRQYGERIGLDPGWRIASAEEMISLRKRCLDMVLRRRGRFSSDLSVALMDEILTQWKEATSTENSDANQFFSEVHDEWSGNMKRRGWLSYDDLETGFLRLIEGGHLEDVRGFEHLFIDEFQDTSALQCKLMGWLAQRAQSVFVVGDPKQSIYRFRGASVENYLKFIERLPQRRRLSVNFRCSQKVVSVVNAMGEQSLPYFEAGRAFREEEGLVALSLKEEEDGEVAEGQALLQAVSHLRMKGFSLDQIVILSRRVRARASLWDWLKTRGLPLQVLSESGFQGDQDLRGLALVWVGLFLPEAECDLYAGLRLLSPSLSASALDRRFTELLEMRGKEGICGLSGHSWVEGWQKFQQFLLNFVATDGSHEIFQSVTYLQFLAWADRFSEHPYGVTEMAQSLKSILRSAVSDVGPCALEPPSRTSLVPVGEVSARGGERKQSGCVRVLSIHGAKGLEFPAVVLTDIAGSRVRSSWSHGFRQDEEGGRALLLGERDEDGEWVRGEALKELRQENELAELQEAARLLYVAATRAESALVFSGDLKGFEKSQGWWAWIKKALDGEGAERICEGAEDFFNDGFGREDENVEAKGLRERNTRRKQISLGGQDPEMQWMASRTGVTALVADHQERHLPSNAVNLWQVHQAMERGSQIHELLEQVSTSDPGLGLSDGDVDVLRGLLGAQGCEGFLRWVRTSEGQLVFAPSGIDREVFVELGFELKAADLPDEFQVEAVKQAHVLVGRMDRVVVEKNSLYIVDFKLLSTSSRNSAEFIERYLNQLRCYALSLAHIAGRRKIFGILLDLRGVTGKIFHCAEL